MHTTAAAQPGTRLAQILTPGRIQTVKQFARFGVVGVVGFIVDTSTVYGLRGLLGLYGAGFAAYGTAATVTWLLNRSWTFRGKGTGPAHRQWVKFLLANLLGFSLNRGTYVLLVTFMPLAAQQPIVATAAGAVAGMFINFSLSRRFVFK